ncbi:MAG: M24 family metallopeptidase [Candidatus Heimdallarchaeota archaeon]|nr:M24 family metallopeptidase [Candidatus Heimdallarchaeota archaeon]
MEIQLYVRMLTEIKGKIMSKAKTPRELQLKIVNEKHEELPSIMRALEIDCWIIFARETSANPDPIMELVIGGDVVWDSAFVFHDGKESFSKTAIVGNFDAPAEEKKGIWDEVIPYKEGISKPLKELVKQIDPSKISLNYSEDDVVSDGLSHGMFLKIANILADQKSKFISASPIIQKVRGRKTKTEIELITKACELTEEINRKITGLIAPGMSETEIQQVYYEEMDRLGVIEAWQRSSCPAIDAGPDKEFGHVGPMSNIKTKKGHTLHNDFGIKLHGYCSDIQRMWFFGSEDEIPEELIHAFETVHGAITRAAEYIKPGVTGFSVDKVARDYVKSRGYEEYAHALGHQVGTVAHDGGVLLGPLWERYGEIPKGLVEENNVFTLELYVKTKNYGMVSLEEDIVVTNDGCRFLVPRQNEFITIE